jgi:ribonuclease P protein component
MAAYVSARERGSAVQKQYRLNRNSQFRYVYRRGAKASCRDLTLLYVKSPQKRVGFSVSKKVGGAVTRNLTKRRLRECMRPRLASMKSGLYVLVAHPSAAQRTYAQLDKSLQALMGKLSLYSSTPPTSDTPQ